MALSKLVLASASPRRRALLAAAGVRFVVIESGVDETRYDDEPASPYAVRMAEAKALAISTSRPDPLVLGADTVVELDGEILLKPLDAEDARRMLHALSSATHTVITAFALARAGRILESVPITARVTFRPLTEAEIERYVLSGEPYDKAGGYGVQDVGAGFVRAVEGSRDTVMGLPVAEVLAAIQRHDVE